MPLASQLLAESKAAVHSVLQKVKNDTYTIKHTSDSSNTADSLTQRTIQQSLGIWARVAATKTPAKSQTQPNHRTELDLRLPLNDDQAFRPTDDALSSLAAPNAT